MATTSEPLYPDQSPFEYDYETLRTTGVILAVIMFVSGILIALTLPKDPKYRYHRQKCLLRLHEGGCMCQHWKELLPALTMADLLRTPRQTDRQTGCMVTSISSMPRLLFLAPLLPTHTLFLSSFISPG
ncbi:FXYD domain containing ion transport regulator 7 isoform X2 [Engraulis encrasicolus]|uniref:FXYD domain containing ion transport regulator 7 isoform X2 n=1 Tax=Engraulis encrasicolus TaxID=184585 RepID=UPI002FD5D84C